MSNRHPATEAARLCILRAGQAEMLCLSNIPEAKKTLEIARNHYRRAKSLGASAAVLDTAAAAGHKAAAAITSAEGAERRREEADAEREASRALAYKKARLSRAYELKGLFTRECAKYVANSLVAKSLATDIPAAVNAIVGLLPCDPLDAKPEHIFEAWLILDPIPTHPLAAPAYAVSA